LDTLTHTVLGACIGEALMGKKIGKKAMLWGALAQNIPDIDVITSSWMSMPDYLLAHRGFLHSFLFLILITPFFALIAERIHRPHNIALKKWILFFGLQIFIHIFIDSFNSYGTGWFEPFSHYRVSFNSVFVLDPLYTIWSLMGCIVLLILKRKSTARRFWWRFGVIMTSLYLGYCIINKMIIDSDVREIFKDQNISHARYFTTPAPLNSWLWFVVAENDSGYYSGFRSVFDKDKMDFSWYPKNDSLLKPVEEQHDVMQLKRFSKGYYTVEKWKDTLVFNDLRFGQINGWEDPNERYVFHYFLQRPKAENILVVQRGRFAKWDWRVIRSLIKRIQGN
jgi:inner membrane protein